MELDLGVGKPARNLADVVRVGVVKMRAVAVNLDLLDPRRRDLVEQVNSQNRVAKQVRGKGSLHKKHLSLQRGVPAGAVRLRHVALHFDGRLPLAGLGNLVGGLHTEKGIHF